MNAGPEPGWYHADGDPIGTHRYWDGEMWQGEAQAVGVPAPGVSAQHSGRLQPGQSLGRAWPRFFARLIDGIIVGIPTVLILLSQIDFEDVDSFTTETGIIWTVLVLAISAIYEIGFIAGVGATPGKMMMGLRVVQENNNQMPPSVTNAALRWVPALAGYIPAVGGLISIVVLIGSIIGISSDSLKRSIYDRVGSTYVISQ